MTNRATFTRLLRDEILKLNLAELDYGIYRILNQRRDVIEDFIAHKLPSMLSRAISDRSGDRLGEVRRRLETLREKLNETAKMLGYAGAFLDGALLDNLTSSPAGVEFANLSAELRYLEAQSGFAQSEEDRLYNVLYTFFARYYRDGDFMTQPRRSRDAKYTVPYSGEDVHIHWKSRGSHYVKTSEELRTYAYRDETWRVVFELRSAEEERDNNKGSARYFIPAPASLVVEAAAHTMTLPFAFRKLTKEEEQTYNGKRRAEDDGDEEAGGEAEVTDKTLKIQERLLLAALSALRPKLPGNLDVALLERNLRRYARKNRSDYFVHASLKAFLTDEFEFYLKNEFLNLDALTTPEMLSETHIKLQVLREMGNAIIALLDQIESFQARLFEKRKFVLRADYLIPVRNLPAALWPEVLANAAQLAAWRALFGLQDPINAAGLKARPTLVVDTRHFAPGFARRALADFEDVDGSTDGVLIHGENYGALQTIRPAFAGAVKVIYIDPPYNTGGDGFLYKDDFSRHSTWMSMMEERLRLAHALLADDGVIFVSIDDNEQANLKALMDLVFGVENFVTTVLWQKVYAPKNTARHFSEDHDFILVYAKSAAKWMPATLARSEEMNARYKNPDNDPRGNWKPSDLLARNHYSKGTYQVTSPGGKTFNNPIGTYWRVSKEKLEQLHTEKRIWWGPENNNMPALKRFLSEVKQGMVPQTLWLYKDVGHTQEAKKELLSIVHFERSEDVLNTVKPTRLLRRVLQISTDEEEPAWVIDFFGGSGTTAHAVMAQNVADGGRRKFLLVEMGEYFEQLTSQRVIRAMYSPEWQDGAPKQDPLLTPLHEAEGASLPEWAERSPRLVKVLRLESFEDSLNALELPKERDARMAGQLSLWGNDYLLKYMLDVESAESPVLLNVERLEAPFDYQLRLTTPEGERTLRVDLVETFNLLMGLHVQRFHELHNPEDARDYVVVEALEHGREVLVVWRPIAGLDPERERTFLIDQLPGIGAGRYTTIYTNADSVLPGTHSLDMLFKQRMLTSDQAWRGLA